MFDLLAQFNQDGLKRGHVVADMVQAPDQFLAGALAVKHYRPHFWPLGQGDCMLRQDGFQGCVAHGCHSKKG